MEETIAISSSPSPCSSSNDEVTARIEDCVTEGAVQQWLENEAFPGFRVWQLAGIVLSVLLSIVIGLCCCVRFRVPRTKQEIEADYIRKRITRSFRRELSKISNTEMDEMDLRKGKWRRCVPATLYSTRRASAPEGGGTPIPPYASLKRQLDTDRDLRSVSFLSLVSQRWTGSEASSRGTRATKCRRNERMRRVAFGPDSTPCSAGCVCVSVRASTRN